MVMHHNIFTRILGLFVFLLSLLFLTQCDLIIGSGTRPGNVGIDLSGFYDDTRAIKGIPDGISITGIRISVFGPGMERIEKLVSPGARYVNMFVPSGENRFLYKDFFFFSYPKEKYLRK